MNSSSEILRFGNPNLAGGTLTQPLVTFALFTYNHEQFILKAIRGALAQSYQPLELIISDDHSTDRTYDIIKDFLEPVTSVHSIILNRNTVNLGIARHIQVVSELASGEILVLAAGDDISHKTRTSIIVEKLGSQPGAMAAFSDAILIDKNSRATIQFGIGFHRSKFIPIRRIVCQGGGVGSGATYAYRTQCLQWPWFYPDTCNIEDKLLPLRAALLGRVLHIPMPLVCVRKLSSSYSHSKDYKSAILDKRHQREIARTIIAACRQKRLAYKNAYTLVKLCQSNHLVAIHVNRLLTRNNLRGRLVIHAIRIRRDPKSALARLIAKMQRTFRRRTIRIDICD